MKIRGSNAKSFPSRATQTRPVGKGTRNPAPQPPPGRAERRTSCSQFSRKITHHLCREASLRSSPPVPSIDGPVPKPIRSRYPRKAKSRRARCQTELCVRLSALLLVVCHRLLCVRSQTEHRVLPIPKYYCIRVLTLRWAGRRSFDPSVIASRRDRNYRVRGR